MLFVLEGVDVVYLPVGVIELSSLYVEDRELTDPPLYETRDAAFFFVLEGVDATDFLPAGVLDRSILAVEHTELTGPPL